MKKSLKGNFFVGKLIYRKCVYETQETVLPWDLILRSAILSLRDSWKLGLLTLGFLSLGKFSFVTGHFVTDAAFT